MATHKKTVGLFSSKKVGFICFNESPFQMMKNTFMLKTLYVLEIFCFYPDFCDYGKRLFQNL